jgi:hypothetical protein
MKRKDNGQFTRTQPWIPLLGATLLTTLGIQTLSMSTKLINQQAEINYLKAYAKSIEIEGLRHWNSWYYFGKTPMTNEKIIQYVFPENKELMTKIAKCESNLNEKAKNKKSTARGLFQVMASVHDVQEKWLYDPFINTLIARKLYEASGTQPWISSIACWGK